MPTAFLGIHALMLQLYDEMMTTGTYVSASIKATMAREGQREYLSMTAFLRIQFHATCRLAHNAALRNDTSKPVHSPPAPAKI